MARAAAVDSTFIGELNANVSIGGSSVVLASTTGIDWLTTGTYAVQVGEDPETDAELVHVTRSGATLTLASPSTTLTKAHTAGVGIYLIVSAYDLNNKLSLDETADQSPVGAVVFNKLAINPDIQDFSGGPVTLDDTVNLVGQYLAPSADGATLDLGTATRDSMYWLTHGSSGIGPVTVTGAGMEPVLIAYGQAAVFLQQGGWFCVSGAATAPDFGGETVYRNSGSPHTFTVPDYGVSQYQVLVVAGGGGGGGCSGAGSQSAAGGGGGAGGGITGVIDVIASETFTVTVGVGGAGGTSAGGTGSTGGDSSIVRDSDSSTLAIAYGGSGGTGMATGTALAVAAGGSPSTATIGSDAAATTQAQAGDPGIRLSSTVAISGGGGMAQAGAGTTGRTGSAVGYTTAGGTDAGGGGGGAVTNSATARAGGAGAEGLVILRPLR